MDRYRYYVSANQVLLVLLAISCQLCEGQNLINICRKDSMNMATRGSLIVQSPGYSRPSNNRKCELKLQNIPRYSLVGINIRDESRFSSNGQLRVDGVIKGFSRQNYTKGTLLYHKYTEGSSGNILLEYYVKQEPSKFKLIITVSDVLQSNPKNKRLQDDGYIASHQYYYSNFPIFSQVAPKLTYTISKIPKYKVFPFISITFIGYKMDDNSCLILSGICGCTEQKVRISQDSLLAICGGQISFTLINSKDRKNRGFLLKYKVESNGCSTRNLTRSGMNFRKSSKSNSVTTTCKRGYTRRIKEIEVVCERNGQWSGLQPCTIVTPSTMPTTVLVTTSLTATTTIAPPTTATALITTAVSASTSSMISAVTPHTPPNMISDGSTILVSPTTTTISSVTIVSVMNISNVESNGGTNNNPSSQPEAKNSKQTISENNNEATLYGSIGGGGGAAIVLIVVAVVVILFRRRQQRFSDTKQNNRTKSRLATTNPAYERNLYVADADGVIQGHVIKETQYYEAEPVGTRRTDVYDNTHGLVNKSSTPDLDDYDVPAAVDVNYDAPAAVDVNYDVPAAVDVNYDVPAAVDDNYDVPAAVDVNYDVPAVEQEDYYNLSFTKKTAEQASNITDIYAEVNKPNREKDNHEADTLVEMIDNDLYDVTQ